MKAELQALLSASLESAIQCGDMPDVAVPSVQIDRTRDASHGDLASNIAMVLAKKACMKPRDLAELIVKHLPANTVVRQCDIAGPGFINFFLVQTAQSDIIKTILNEKQQFGRNSTGAGRKVQVEFVSANPTGPLHVGHGRGAAVGDCICRLLQATGWEVTREFYYNDAGQQINNLTQSVQLRCLGRGPDDADWPEDGYRGDYIVDIASAYMRGDTISASDQRVTGKADPNDAPAIREFAVAYLRQEQDLDLNAFAVQFDVFSLESALYADGSVEQTVQQLQDQGHCYEKDQALWLRTTDFGDDKDRVMRKTDGGYTYFVPDVAYHKAKWQRGFERVINEQGADHHSTITRVRAGLQALNAGIPEGWPEYVLHQMVTVLKNGEEVKISKRAGSYVTLRDLIEEVGCDATRYFLAARRPDSQLTFDIDLALQQSNDNPVYYIQYAHARVCSVQRQAEEKHLQWDAENGQSQLGLLDSDTELALMKSIAAYPELVENAAKNLEPHAVANFLRDLAANLHGWYNSCQFLVEDKNLRDARLSLAEATRQVISNGLDLLGVSAPEHM